MARPKSKAKGLKPKACKICKELFQPWTSRQKVCEKPECRRIYGNQKQLEKYHRLKKEKKKIKTLPFIDYKREFSVDFVKRDDKWYWKAVGDNESRLENGPFDTINDARKDYHEAIE